MFRRSTVALFSLFLAFMGVFPASAEIYPNIDESVRFYLDVPKGKLPEVLHWSPGRMPLVSQHRGGPMPGYPENALETLDNALKYGPGVMEVDVATLKDGTMILMHDYTLDRTTTGSGRFADVTWAYVKDLKLKDNDGAITSFHVPLLKDVLIWATGKTILNLDLKRGTDFARMMQLVEETGAGDNVMAISYSLEQAKEFNEIAPNTMLSVRIRSAKELAEVQKMGIPLDRVVGWTGLKLQDRSVYTMLHSNGIMVMQGTLGFDETALDHQIKLSGDDSEYMKIIGLGADIIATDRHWAAQQAIRYPSLVYFVRGRTTLHR